MVCTEDEPTHTMRIKRFNFTLQNAYGLKSIQVYFHHQQTTCDLHLPLGRNGHLNEDGQVSWKSREASWELVFSHLWTSLDHE